MAVEQLMGGFAVTNPSRILETYLFCCPAMDGNFRCLPKLGGYLEQDNSDMVFFRLIEDRISDIQKRKKLKEGK